MSAETIDFSSEYGLFVQSERPHHEPPFSYIEVFEGGTPEAAQVGRQILRWGRDNNVPTLWTGRHHAAAAERGLRKLLTAWWRANR